MTRVAWSRTPNAGKSGGRKKNFFFSPLRKAILATSYFLNFFFFLRLQRYKWQGEEKIEEKEEDLKK